MAKKVKNLLRPGMNPTLTVAVVQLEAKMADKDANLRKVLDYIKKAAKKKAEMVVFPEMCLTGYTCGADLDKSHILYELAETIPGPTANTITKAAKENNIYVIVGMPEANTEFPGHIHNSALFTGPEGIVGVSRKIHLPTLPLVPPVREIQWGLAPGNEVPVWKIKQGWNISINICYDQWIPEIPRIQALKGADVIVCISAGPQGFKEGWYMVNQVRAQENTAFIVYSNFVGKQWGDVTFHGAASIVGPNCLAGGTKYVAKAPEYKEAMVVGTLDVKELLDARMVLPTLRDRRPSVYKEITRFPTLSLL